MGIRPIDANALLGLAHNHVGGTVDCNDIARFPTIDYAPVVHGEWLPWIEEVEIYNTGGFREPKQVGWLCSKCKKGHCQMHRNFCPDCGAKMDGGKEHGKNSDA